MKKIKQNIILLLMLGLFTTLLSGCEFTFLQNSEPIEISGYVTFQGQPLENVKIVSDFYQYTSTNANGYFNFVTRSKNLVFHAKKAGYSFMPKTYDINFPQETYNFEAVQAETLKGILTLNQILIAPTSIISIPGNNYEYQFSQSTALKFHSFAYKINQNAKETISLNSEEPFYLEKNTFTNILLENPNFEFEVNHGINNLNFEFELKAFYKISAFAEEVSSERISLYKNNTNLDTGDLDEDNNVKFSIPSINSYSNGFTYNLQLVFKYTKN